MNSSLNALISRHTTQWFHRVNMDELSPAISLQEITTRILNSIEGWKMSITVSRTEFRKNLCEFLCTYYISKKRDVAWRGPFSEAPRPRGWKSHHETDWYEYLRHEHFSTDFWESFWDYTPEAIWESRTSGWRDCVEYVILHYIVVQPQRIDIHLSDYNDGEYGSEDE